MHSCLLTPGACAAQTTHFVLCSGMQQRPAPDFEVWPCPAAGADHCCLVMWHWTCPSPPHPSCSQEILSKDKEKKIKAVAVVHNETTTGVTSDIRGVRAAMDAADHPALLLVDGVSSIGALEFKFDDWGVDVAVTGSQKALSLPTGLALVCASDKVRRCRVCWAAGRRCGPAMRMLSCS